MPASVPESVLVLVDIENASSGESFGSLRTLPFDKAARAAGVKEGVILTFTCQVRPAKSGEAYFGLSVPKDYEVE